MRSGAALAVGAMFLTAGYLRRRKRRYDLPGKTVLITGGARGLGLVLAREFGSRGARVAICARNPEELDRADEELQSRQYPTLPVLCDVTSRAMGDSLLAGDTRRLIPRAVPRRNFRLPGLGKHPVTFRAWTETAFPQRRRKLFQGLTIMADGSG